jgi:hypothetical protein
MPLDDLTAFLRACAAIDLDAKERARLADAASRVAEWTPLAARAEEHGLAPLVRRHVRTCGIALPGDVPAQLASLAVRHRDAGRARADALIDIVHAFDTAGIAHVALKGAALAHDIYPSPDLRPARDIDLLVAPGAGRRAVSLLASLDFERTGELPPWAHHHLPAVARTQAGYQVTVEIHEQALSADQPDQLTLDTLTSPPRSIPIGAGTVRAPGHADMLRHLTAHLLDPRRETRLLGIVDLVAYAAHHAGEIDWAWLDRHHARVVNALALTHFLRPLPAPLQFLVPSSRAPAGVGLGLPPLHTVSLLGNVGVGALLHPSDWWMHAYYGVPAGRSLAWTRWSRHAPQIVRWILRRVVASSPRGDLPVRARAVARLVVGRR